MKMRKGLSRSQITRKVYRLRDKWDKDGYSPRAVNNGCCDEFASELVECCKTGRSLWGDDPRLAKFFKAKGILDDAYGHCFFKYRRWFFDIECPVGVEDPTELPYYQRCIESKLRKEGKDETSEKYPLE